MAKEPWRFQCDRRYGETDPKVTVFMGELETDEETGEVSIRQDTKNPVEMKLSELKSAMHLADPSAMGKVADMQRGERIKRRQETEAKAAEEAKKNKAVEPKAPSVGKAKDGEFA